MQVRMIQPAIAGFIAAAAGPRHAWPRTRAAAFNIRSHDPRTASMLADPRSEPARTHAASQDSTQAHALIQEASIKEDCHGSD